MPSLFPKHSNKTMRLVLALIGLFIVGCPTALMIYVRTPYVTGVGYGAEQPVEFDHRHHSRDDGIDCRYCHNLVDRSPYAGIPPTNLCMGCHNQIWNESPLLEPVRRSYYSGEPIPWRRVHDLPDFVYFDHSVHVNNGVGCVSCHGPVDQMAQVYQVATLDMQWCLACHRDPRPFLRPLEEITSTDWVPDGDPSVVGAALAEAFGVESLTYCTACHR